MAKFTLMVETEDAAEIADITAAINGASAPINTGFPDYEGQDVGAAAPPPKQTRIRRTKEQIAADEAAAKAAAQPAGPAVEEIVTEKGTSAAGLLGEAEPVAVTFDDVKTAMLALIDRKGADTAKAVLVANGVPGRLGEAPKDKYAALADAFAAA